MLRLGSGPSWVQVLAEFQTHWGLQLPEPVQAYICDLEVAKEIRLAAFLAWMRCHAHLALRGPWWSDWLQALLQKSDVALLRNASDDQVAWMSHIHPTLGERARTDRAQWKLLWQHAGEKGRRVWQHIPFLKPGSKAPWSYPIGAFLFVLLGFGSCVPAGFLSASSCPHKMTGVTAHGPPTCP